ncbi:MAG: type II secretion system F family protein [Bdellovibrionales bacterium]|nr:type II secretion system F family protein [Bdellovibrionales bacterium]
MDATLVLILVVAAIAAAAAVFVVIQFAGESSGVRGQMKNIVASQREAKRGFFGLRENGTSIFKTAQESRVERKTSARLTMRKRLKFAQWKMPPVVFRLLEVSISLIALAITSSYFNIAIQAISCLTGPIFMRWLLNLFMDRRFKAFDKDYPQMILSLVGLLKTGMNPMAALEAAAQGLDEGALVREEIELMITRLRYGVPEDKSIGAFGEDIYHPEIELFVQALLLSRRVGGTLSDTLERLAKQVRKRQYFRNSAKAAVGMQRGSIWFIVFILVGMECYLYTVYPEAVKGAWADEFGWQVWQFGLIVIMLGIFWVRQVTKIRV